MQNYHYFKFLLYLPLKKTSLKEADSYCNTLDSVNSFSGDVFFPVWGENLLWDVCFQPEQRHHGQRHPGALICHVKHRHRPFSVSLRVKLNLIHSHTCSGPHSKHTLDLIFEQWQSLSRLWASVNSACNKIINATSMLIWQLNQFLVNFPDSESVNRSMDTSG